MEGNLICSNEPYYFGFCKKPDTQPIVIPTKAFCDGESVVSSLYTSKNQVRNKRRRVDIASLKEAVEDGILDVQHIPTQYTAADALTKRMATDT